MSIYKKLLEIQKKVNGLGKDKTSGSGSFGYKYVTGSKVLENIKPIMNEQGIILKQEVIKAENERIDYKTKNGDKSEMLFKVWLRFTWIDTDTGEKDINEFFASGMNDWEKGLGSALTYAERYFLLKFFHINTDEDDIDNPDRKTDGKKPFNKDNAINAILKIAGEDDEILGSQLSYHKLKGLQDGTEAQLKAIYKYLEKSKN